MIKGRKIKIVISGVFFPLTMMGYFIRAFERRNDIELQTVGPFTGSFIPWGGGMQIHPKYVKIPNIALTPDSIQRGIPSAPVQSQLPWEPDLWLQIDAGWHFINKPRATIVGHIGTDPHCLLQFYAPAKRLSDICWGMQTPYLESGDKYLPYAYDPTIHFHEDLPKEYDACLVGLHYDQRNHLVEMLRMRGRTVYYGLGEIYDEYRQRYNSSRVALSWSSLLDLPARVWEAMAMKSPLVTNRVPDLVNFFVEGEDYLGFDDVVEATKKAEQLMDSPELAQSLAESAYEKASKFGTWDERVKQILQECKFIE
jgi:hypothetical protein